jgi:Leucine-rich repeat (LRR) protein
VTNCFGLLDKLTHLSLEHNGITSLEYLSPLVQLLELYIGENQITDIKEIRFLSNLEKLIVVDLWGNPICKDFDYRLFVIYHIKDVKVLDGISISQSEYEEAKEAFTGRLSEELLQVKLAGKDFAKIEVMDLTNSSLRDFHEIFNSKKFPNCSELNLEGNFFSSFRCFGFMPNLKILIMRNNRLQDLDMLWDPNAPKEMLKDSNATGLGALTVSFLLLKKIETGSVGYQ